MSCSKTEIRHRPITWLRTRTTLPAWLLAVPILLCTSGAYAEDPTPPVPVVPSDAGTAPVAPSDAGTTSEPTVERPAVQRILPRPGPVEAKEAVEALQRRRNQTAALAQETEADRKALRVFIDQHFAHANSGDVDAYMADFIPQQRDNAMIRAYTERVMQSHRPTLTMESFEVQKLSRSSARLRVTQVANYTDERGRAVEARAAFTYRMRKAETGWLLESTSRKRIEDQAPTPSSEQAP